MNGALTFCLAGDVMTGRGIDQILPNPSAPGLHEPYVTDARTYLTLAERRQGQILRPAGYRYVWGGALDIWRKVKPDVRVANLETSVTGSDDFFPKKTVHYRMNPRNVDVLKVPGIHAFSLANNHIMDWGYGGLVETLGALKTAGIRFAGAGRTIREAAAPVIVPCGKSGRVLFFAVASPSSGVPIEWAADRDRPGVHMIFDLSRQTSSYLAEAIAAVRKPNDFVVVSIHWGTNWGYQVPEEQIRFARALIDRAHVDVVHGHSSHHIRPFEIYGGRPIFYGCGDIISDYEGIESFRDYRDDLAALYFVKFRLMPRRLERVWLVPLVIEKFRLRKADPVDIRWLEETLNRESMPWNTELGVVDGEIEVSLPPPRDGRSAGMVA